MPRQYRNIAKEKLLAGQMTFGFQVRAFADAAMARAIAASGFDFAFIDLQHTAIDIAQASSMAIALGEASVTPIARIAEGDFAAAGRLIDGGVQGIVVPQVDTLEQARAAVDGCKYRPVGAMWRGDSSIHFGWAPPPDPSQTLAMAINSLLMLIVMVESEEAVDNIDVIAALDGIDVISVGSSDLAGSMGLGTDYDHPRLRAAWEKVAAVARRNGKGLRIGGVKAPQAIARTYELGSRMIITGNDITTLTRGMRNDLATLRQSAADY